MQNITFEKAKAVINESRRLDDSIPDHNYTASKRISKELHLQIIPKERKDYKEWLKTLNM